MERDRIKFGVNLDRKLDGQFQEIADFEDRPKVAMHRVLVRRVVQIWNEKPERLIELGLIQRSH